MPTGYIIFAHNMEEDLKSMLGASLGPVPFACNPGQGSSFVHVYHRCYEDTFLGSTWAYEIAQNEIINVRP
jgi:hypothetical protein